MEMVMKFPNGETPNLLIEVFNYNAACALQIRYTSGFGRSRHVCEVVTDTCVRLHEMFLLTLVRWECPPSILLLLWWELRKLRRQGKWQWNRHRWSGREGGTQVLKCLSVDCNLSVSWLLQSTCHRVLQPDIELQIASNGISWVCDWVRTVTAPEEQAAPTACGCVSTDIRTLVPSIWKGAKQMLDSASMATSWLGHLFTLLLAEIVGCFFLLIQPETHWSFRCLRWSRGYFTPVCHKHSA